MTLIKKDKESHLTNNPNVVSDDNKEARVNPLASHKQKEKTDYLLCIGASDKTDILLHLGLALSRLDKRVLIVDVTKNQNYAKGYTTMDQALYDFQGVDIASGKFTKKAVEILLKEHNETFAKYDVVLVDIDQAEFLHTWGEQHRVLYVGSDERLATHDDGLLLDAYRAESTGKIQYVLQQYSDNALNEEDIDEMLNLYVIEKNAWAGVPLQFVKEERDIVIRSEMQYHLMFNEKRLSSSYKKSIAQIISALYGHHKKEVISALKRRCP